MRKKKKSVNQLGLQKPWRFGSRPSTLIERLLGKRHRKYLISPKACIWGSSLAHITQEYSCALASCYRMTRVRRCSMREGLLPFPSLFWKRKALCFTFSPQPFLNGRKKGKGEPEAGPLASISLLCSLPLPQGNATDGQQTRGMHISALFLLLLHCHSCSHPTWMEGPIKPQTPALKHTREKESLKKY